LEIEESTGINENIWKDFQILLSTIQFT
jgi:hypothetical protein